MVDTMSMNYLHLSLFDVYNLIRVAITQVITHCAVPIFYIISGYLFYQKLEIWDVEVYRQKIKKRINTVGIPYLVWISIMILYTVAALAAGCLLHGKPWSRILDWFSSNGWWHLYWDCHVWNVDRLNLIGLPMPASSPVLIPFWFMRDLIIVLAITPVIFWAIKKLKSVFVMLLLASYVSGVWIPLAAPCVDAVLFFSIGGYIAIENKDFVEWMGKFRLLSYTLSAVLLPFMIYYNGHNTEMGNILYPFFILAMCGTTINVISFCVRQNKLGICRKYNDATFFVFASHIFLLPYISWAVKLVTKHLGTLGDIVAYLIIPIITLILCIIFCRIIKTTTPRIANVLGCR